MKRNFRLGALAAREAARHTVSRKSEQERVEATARELVRVLGSMKGAAMKFGQVLSTLDLPFEDEATSVAFREELRKLQSSAPTVEWPQMKKVMEQEWGKPVTEVLRDIDPEPVAAASVGQVYRGTTHNGETVAIKVQYPHVGNAVESDMKALKMMTPPLLKRIAPALDVKALIEELTDRITEELDYELEASRHRSLERSWRGHPWIWIPHVYNELSHRRVLVTEWVEGDRWTDILTADEDVRERLAEGMLRFYFSTLSRFGVVCGDPHPGNLLLAGDRIAFLDFGMIRTVDQVYRDGERELMLATLDRDAPTVKRLLNELSFLPAGIEFDEDLLLEQTVSAAELWIDDRTYRMEPNHVRHYMMKNRSPLSPFFEQMRTQTIDPQSLLIRRMEDMLWSGVGELRAEHNWGALMRDILGRGAYQTPLAIADAQWWNDKNSHR